MKDVDGMKTKHYLSTPHCLGHLVLVQSLPMNHTSNQSFEDLQDFQAKKTVKIKYPTL